MKIQRRTLLKGGLAAAAQYMVSCSKAGQLLNSSERSLIELSPRPILYRFGADADYLRGL